MMHESIKAQIAVAMKAKDAVRVGVLRDLVAKFVNELVAKGKKPNETLGDDDALAIVRRAVRQRNDSIDQFLKGGRIDLVEIERAELIELEKFLPTMMSRDEVYALVKKIAGENPGAAGGKLIGMIMKAAAGRANGQDVKSVVEVIGVELQ